jgi:hypothetical protein
MTSRSCERLTSACLEGADQKSQIAWADARAAAALARAEASRASG